MPEVFDSTMLGDSLGCLRLFYWRHERHLVPVTPSLPLAFGQAVHASLAAHYKGGSLGECLEAFSQVWDSQVTPFMEDEMEDPNRNPLKWAELLLAYREFYSQDPLLPLGVEVPFIQEIDGDLYYCGILDLVAKLDGRTVVVDHKTTSRVTANWVNSFTLSHQVAGYLWGANAVMGAEAEVTTLIINAIVTKGGDKPFYRIPITRSPAVLELWRRDVVGWWKVVQRCRESGVWPMNPLRCFAWTPGCPYWTICSSVEAPPPDYEPPDSLFRVEKWDPVSRLEEAQRCWA